MNGAEPYSRILHRFSDALGRPDLTRQRLRAQALFVKMRAHGLSVRQDRGRDWEHGLTALWIKTHLPAGARILDVGGGGSLFCYELALSGYSVMVLDIDPQVIEVVRYNVGVLGLHDRLDAALLDGGASWPQDDGTADSVVSISVFEALLGQQRARFFAEVHRVLKPGADLLLTFDFGPGAKLLGDPPVDIEAVCTEIIEPSGLSFEEPLPTPPSFTPEMPPPMRMAVLQTNGMDYTTAEYTFAALRLTRRPDREPPMPEPVRSLAVDGATSPEELCRVLSRDAGTAARLRRLGSLVVGFELFDEAAIRRFNWIMDEAGCRVGADGEAVPSVILAGTGPDLLCVLREPDRFWQLHYRDALFPRGDLSIILRVLDCLPRSHPAEKG